MILPSFLELANFFAGFNIHEGMRHAFRSLEIILKRDHQCTSFSAISLPGHGKNTTDRLRVLWGKDDFRGQRIEKVFYEKLLKDKKSDLKESFVLKDDQFFYSFIYIDDAGDQVRWLVLEFSEIIGEEFKSLLTTFFHKCSIGEKKYNKILEVENLIYEDDVTGLFNQRKLLIDIESSIKNYQDHSEPFSVLFIDIDHFKKVNDSHGHLVGTKALKDMGTVLKDTFRENDSLYRYGGDEFVAIIPNIDKASALSLAERILATIKKFPFKAFSDDRTVELSLSVSIGVALYPDDATTKQDILEIADAMMYKAKKSGRGRVCLTKDLIEQP